MPNKVLIFLCSIYLICLISSCGTTKPEESSPDLGDIGTVEALPEVSVSAQKPIYRTEKTKYWLLRHTQLDLRPDIVANMLQGEALIWVQPFAAGKTDNISLDAKYLHVDSVAICANNISPNYQEPIWLSNVKDHQKSPYKLNLKFDKIYSPDDTVCLYIKYYVTPDSVPSGGSASIRERKGVYMLHPDEYHTSRPTQLWTQGEPESASFWFPTLDAPNQKTTEVIRVHHHDSLVSLSNGLMIDSYQEGMTRTDVWSNNLPISPYLFTLIVADLHMDSSDHYKAIDLSYLVDPNYAIYAKDIYDHTPEMIQYFSDITGVEYPWQKYAQAIVHDFVSGAMENTSAVTFGKFVQKNKRELIDKPNDNIVAHELFHHWFGDLVTFESWTHITLSESFATLGALLWREYHEGPLRAAEERHSMLRTYLQAAQEDEPPLIRKYYKKPGEVFDRISYQKGALILYMLRHQLGEKTFNAAMAHYLHENAYATAEIDDWRKAIEKVTGRDFSQFFDEWYYRPRIPRIRMKITQKEAQQYSLLEMSYVDNSEVYNIAPELLCIPRDSDEWRMQLPLRDSTQEWTIPYVNGQPVHLILDPDQILAADIRYLCSVDYWKKMFNAPLYYDQIYNAIKYLKDERGERDVQLSLSNLAARNEIGISTLAAKYIRSGAANDELYREKFDRIIQNPDAESALRSELVRVMSSPPKTENTVWLKKLCQDKSYAVCAAALKAIDSIDHDYAIQYAIDSIQSAHGDLYVECLRLLAVQDTNIYLPILTQEVQRKYGVDCYYPSYYLCKSLLHQSDQTIFEKVVNTLIEKAATDDLKSLQDYVLKHLYNTYIKLSKKEEKSKAGYIKNEVEKTLYTAWDDEDRVEALKSIYTWQLKL